MKIGIRIVIRIRMTKFFLTWGGLGGLVVLVFLSDAFFIVNSLTIVQSPPAPHNLHAVYMLKPQVDVGFKHEDDT